MSKANKDVAKKPTAKKPTGVRMFLVVREAFEVGDWAGLSYSRPMDEDAELPSVVPVRAFASKAEAIVHAARLDDEIRATFPVPLFADDRLTDDDSRPFAETVTALLKRFGLPACKFKKKDRVYEQAQTFREWWARHAADMSAEQRAALWEPFAGMTFHRVKQVELEG